MEKKIQTFKNLWKKKKFNILIAPWYVSIWDFSRSNEFLLIAITKEQLLDISNNLPVWFPTDSDREWPPTMEGKKGKK